MRGHQAIIGHKAHRFRAVSPDEIDDALALIEAAPVPQLPRRNPNKPLYIYGMGKLGKLAREFFAHIGERTGYEFDQDYMRSTSLDKGAQVAVAISAFPYVPVEQQVFRGGFADVVPFYDLAETMRGDRHPLANGWLAPALSDQDKGQIADVWRRWEDDVSRAHHLQFLAWRCIREEWTFAGAPVTTCNPYFIPEVVSVLHDHEVFLDGGAYRGDVSRRLIELTKGTCIAVAIEADRANTLTPIALSERNGVTLFAGGFGLCSRIDPCGGDRVPAHTIDSLERPFTFMKLHLEGGELPALKGAFLTMVEHRPIVTANVDHNADGLWRTAAWLMDCLDNYRFLFRNHAWCAAGTVVYAIPNERMQ